MLWWLLLACNGGSVTSSTVVEVADAAKAPLPLLLSTIDLPSEASGQTALSRGGFGRLDPVAWHPLRRVGESGFGTLLYPVDAEPFAVCVWAISRHAYPKHRPKEQNSREYNSKATGVVCSSISP